MLHGTNYAVTLRRLPVLPLELGEGAALELCASTSLMDEWCLPWRWPDEAVAGALID